MAPRAAAKAMAWKSSSGPSGEAVAGHVAHLKDMGFKESEARKALAECVWDVNRAIDLLVSRGAVALAPLPKLPKSVVRNDSSEIACNKSRDYDNSTTASSVSTPRFQHSASLATESGQSSEHVAESKEVSNKPIRRLCKDALGQDAGLLAAKEGDFLRIWPHSQTELGWIYAEDPTDASRAGWLPSMALEDVQEGHAWLLVLKTMPKVHDNQLSVEEGEVLKVNLSSRTPEGWAYAERVSSSNKTSEAGWAPVISLCWDSPAE